MNRLQVLVVEPYVSWEGNPPACSLGMPYRMHSKSEIVTAGKILRETLVIEDIPVIEEKRGMGVLSAFKIAHAWRDAHMLPLLRVRQELGGKLRSIEKGAVSAARLKRMASIRRKLQKPITLYQMQDIAGCRAILRSMKEVDRLIEFYRSGGSKYELHSEDAYIESPKRDGYRSHHLIMKFQSSEAETTWNRQNVEIQIRSRPQHAWATAVESVGLIRGENIKGGSGDGNWRRFFELMSSEIAYEEECPVCPSASGTREEIRSELKDLCNEINAVSVLETYNRAIHYASGYGSTYARYFLLQFDYETREVYVTPFHRYDAGADSYIEAEKANEKRNSVLVEVNKVTDLQKAFPNYFLDVSEFTARLKRVLGKSDAVKGEYDLSWLKAWKRRR